MYSKLHTKVGDRRFFQVIGAIHISSENIVDIFQFSYKVIIIFQNQKSFIINLFKKHLRIMHEPLPKERDPSC